MANASRSRAPLWTLALGSVGVVYGDIGTSPLYALKESLTAATAGGALTESMVIGVMSLMLWALTIIVTLKYVWLIMSADNHGEGGTLSLMALLQRAMGHNFFVISLLGMAGAALFYGDAIITPAISVLSAVEGMKLVAPAFDPFILPLSMIIIIGLFFMQSRGTALVAAWFGPIMMIWFLVMALGGAIHLAGNLGILAAINPIYGATFMLTHGQAGLLALGAVFLTVTGAEALYADMGHFGSRPIRAAWLIVVMPSLLLNYLGQGALLLARPEKLENPFFLLYPDWVLLPMVLLATVATIIASQAVISGAFSLTHQAMQLGLLPRMEIRRTSETEKGQIYIPRINWLLLIAVLYRLRIQVFQRACVGLRSGGHRHHGDHQHHGLFCHVEVLAMESCFRCLDDCAVSRGRFDFLVGQSSQDIRGWVAAARRWGVTDAPDGDLASGNAHSGGGVEEERSQSCRFYRHDGQVVDYPSFGDSGVPDRQSRCDANSFAAQHQAQQGFASEQHRPESRYRRHAAGR
ncbi:MAG: system potassium uptake protein [Bradyrhizobium sp.]|nr:system potassium uptake protein [Bradyrhizobium sp.]